MSKRPTLTRAQQRVYEAAARLCARMPYRPSIREIAAEAKLSSVAGVCNQLAALEALGYIQRQRGQPRSLVVVA